MIDSRMITLFALLAVLCVVFLLLAIPLAIWSAVRGGPPEWLVPIREGFADVALPMAAVVAVVTTFGSLWLSEVEKLPPCELCWFQRIAMYPMAVILPIAAFRRDVSIRIYAIPVALIGAAVSTYHYLVERFPDSVSTSCSTDVPCSTVWIWKFHFLSIPGMAWIAFITITVLLLLARRPADRADSDDDVHADILESVTEGELTR